jgi:hypothetical protein
LSRPNVRKHGVSIQGEAVVHGEHTLYMIVESSDEAQVLEFMQPFAMAGSLDIYPAATCARIVASGGCAATMPAVDDALPALEPEEATVADHPPGGCWSRRRALCLCNLRLLLLIPSYRAL